jgi:hypothetical protein
VITAIPLLTTAGQAVVGYIDPAIALPSTLVSVQQDGVLVKATAPDLAGKFTLYPVPAGNYELVITAEGRATAVMTGVPVDTVAVTNVSSAGVPIVPSIASFGTAPVTGTVTPATDGARCGRSAPGRRSRCRMRPSMPQRRLRLHAAAGSAGEHGYVASPTSISFSADLTAAGLYTIEATSGGVVRRRTSTPLAVPPVIHFP